MGSIVVEFRYGPCRFNSRNMQCANNCCVSLENVAIYSYSYMHVIAQQVFNDWRISNYVTYDACGCYLINSSNWHFNFSIHVLPQCELSANFGTSMNHCLIVNAWKACGKKKKRNKRKTNLFSDWLIAQRELIEP